jgi:hypothetical protein
MDGGIRTAKFMLSFPKFQKRGARFPPSWVFGFHPYFIEGALM